MKIVGIMYVPQDINSIDTMPDPLTSDGPSVTGQSASHGWPSHLTRSRDAVISKPFVCGLSEVWFSDLKRATVNCFRFQPSALFTFQMGQERGQLFAGNRR